MATVKVYGKDNAVVLYNSPSAHYGPTALMSLGSFGANDLALQSFDAVPEAYRYCQINGATLNVCFVATNGSASGLSNMPFYYLSKPFDPDSVTYNTTYRGTSSSWTLLSSEQGYLSRQIVYLSELLANGFAMGATYYRGFYTNDGANPPYIEIDFGDPVGLTVKPFYLNPTYVDQAVDETLQWSVSPASSGTFEPVGLTSAVLRWRESGSTVTHDIHVGAVTSYTVPAGTFPAGSIEWQIEATANSGVVTTSEWDTVIVRPPQIAGMSPAAGAYVPKYRDSIFSWATQHESTVLPQASAVFRWRVTGSDIVNTVSVGSTASVTIPAGTFAEDSIDWQVETTTDSGVVTTSEWVTVSTVEALSSANPVYPRNTTVDGSAPITFVWEHIISTGTMQTAFELELSADAALWEPLTSGTGAASSYTLEADALDSGEHYWRVRTCNTDDTPGEWSAAARFLVIKAPSAPVISTTDPAPRFSIRWQQSGQQAYEVRLDGKVIARQFGESSNYTYDDYLMPGAHIVEVRIQNRYSLWSPWGSASLVITNVPGAAIALTVTAGESVRLEWTADEPYEQYLVYRDGVLIGRTSDGVFEDPFAAGETTYQVRGVYEDSGNYTLSDPVTVVVPCECLMIADAENPEWLPLRLSDTSLRALNASMSHGVSYVHLVGEALPGAVVGEARTESLQLVCAFPVSDTAGPAALEMLLGRLVCVKSPWLAPTFAVLDRLDRMQNRFYRSYALTLTRVAHKEGLA